MRRTIPFVAALALVAVLVAPAAASPKKALTWNVTCEGTSFTVLAPLGVPGWPIGGTSPILLVGGTFTVTEDGVTADPIVDPVPPGLVGRVQACSIDGPAEFAPSVFHVHSDPAYMLFTG